MDISNINGISTGDIKSFFNNTSLTKTDKTDSFSDVLSAAMGRLRDHSGSLCMGRHRLRT